MTEPLCYVNRALSYSKEFMYLWFAISVRTDHDINQHRFLDLSCLLKCAVQRCSQFIRCLCKVTFPSERLDDSLVTSLWLQSSRWSPEESKLRVYILVKYLTLLLSATSATLTSCQKCITVGILSWPFLSARYFLKWLCHAILVYFLS